MKPITIPEETKMMANNGYYPIWIDNEYEKKIEHSVRISERTKALDFIIKMRENNNDDLQNKITILDYIIDQLKNDYKQGREVRE